MKTNHETRKRGLTNGINKAAASFLRKELKQVKKKKKQLRREYFRSQVLKTAETQTAPQSSAYA